MLLLFYVLDFWPGGTWDLSSPGIKPSPPALDVKVSLNHWATGEVLQTTSLKVLKEKRLNLEFYPEEMSFRKERLENRVLRRKKKDKIHRLKTYTTRNFKSSS